MRNHGQYMLSSMPSSGWHFSWYTKRVFAHAELLQPTMYLQLMPSSDGIFHGILKKCSHMLNTSSLLVLRIDAVERRHFSFHLYFIDNIFILFDVAPKHRFFTNQTHHVIISSTPWHSLLDFLLYHLDASAISFILHRQ